MIKKNRLTELIHLRSTREDKANITKIADKEKISLSTFVLKIVKEKINKDAEK